MNMLRNGAMLMLATTTLITSSISIPLRGALTFAASLAGGTVAGACAGGALRQRSGNRHVLKHRSNHHAQLELRLFDVSSDLPTLAALEAQALCSLQAGCYDECVLQKTTEQLVSNQEFCQCFSNKLGQLSFDAQPALEYFQTEFCQGKKYSTTLKLDARFLETLCLLFSSFLSLPIANSEDPVDTAKFQHAASAYNKASAKWFDKGWGVALRHIYDQEASCSSIPTHFNTCSKLLKNMLNPLDTLCNAFRRDESPYIQRTLDAVRKLVNAHIITNDGYDSFCNRLNEARSFFAAAAFSLDLLQFTSVSGALSVEMSTGQKAMVIVKDAAKGAAVGALAGGGVGYCMGGSQTAIKGAKYGAVAGATLGAGYATAYDIDRQELMVGYQNKLEAQMCFLNMAVASVNEGLIRVFSVLEEYNQIKSKVINALLNVVETTNGHLTVQMVENLHLQLILLHEQGENVVVGAALAGALQNNDALQQANDALQQQIQMLQAQMAAEEDDDDE